MVDNEDTGGEWDEDAAMDVWSHEERLKQKRTYTGHLAVPEEEDRKPGGKTHVRDGKGGVKEDAVTKWKNDIQYHSGNPRWWEKPEEILLLVA